GRQRHLEAKRRSREQAEHVTAWLLGRTDENGSEGRITVPVRIHNASQQVVYDLVAQIVRVPLRVVRGGLPAAKTFNHEVGACVGNVPPDVLEHVELELLDNVP